MDPAISFDRVARVYDATRRLPDAIAPAVVAAIARRVGTESLLEAGVGTGRWGAPVASRGIRVTGVDVSRRMLDLAREKGLGALALADVRRLPFRGAAFAYSMSNHLLHLVRDWPSVLRELARVTRGQYLSVVELTEEDPDLSQEYQRLARAEGLPVDPPGLSERRLRDLLPPDFEEHAAAGAAREPVERFLGPIERREYRYTWVTPEAEHARFVRELRSRYGRAEVASRFDIRLAAWSARRLASFADAPRPG